MSHDFWAERWEKREIGFHRPAVHDTLVAHADWLLDGGRRRVLVPLCGKTLDLDWLADQGHDVVGVELVARAVEELFAGRSPRVADAPWGRLYTLGRLTVAQGDWFAVAPTLGTFDAVWDRAALVALPADVRVAYARLLRERVRPGGRILLDTFEYDETVMSGPPFSIPEGEVRGHYTGFDVEKADERDLVATEPGWRERGHRWFLDRVWRIAAR